MEDTLQEVFEKATHIKVPQNQNGKAKGYTFIEFASFEDAKEALNSCNKREIEGRAIRLELQGPRGSPNARSRKSLVNRNLWLGPEIYRRTFAAFCCCYWI